MRLTTRNHDRDSAGLTYVYPVVSRRAQGVSIGVNLNPNNACNWRCVYCQVPDLVRGAGPELDLALLEEELSGLLGEIVHGDWMERVVPEGSRRLNDVALSGNGEATTSKQFDAALEVVERVLASLDVLGEVKVVLITNGSQVHKPDVQAGLARMARIHGEVWFKLDAGTAAGRARLNDIQTSDERVEQNLELAARLCPTRIQTMALAFDGAGPSPDDEAAWVALVRRVLDRGAPIRDVLLYGFARDSHQPEAARLSALPEAELRAMGERLATAVALDVHVHV